MKCNSWTQMARTIIEKTMRRRGREYAAFFEVRKVGAYHLDCGSHSPSMTTTILVRLVNNHGP